jgi:hypothetical protein
MRNRSKRVLWLLNHKTLMPYEVPLLLSLGFEVFTPKVIPEEADFRSGSVTFDYDASLTIPPDALRRLNEFDFYTTEWSADITAIVNRYFGTVYTIPYSIQVREVVRKFEGQVMFRAFGMANTRIYERGLAALFDDWIFAEIYALGDRFWFAQGYEQLAEVEPPLIANRAIFLPVGVPKSFWKTENTWTGIDRRILFACSNCVTNTYYRNVYETFKREFGHLPHVIVGAQDVPVDDPNVLGFVSDEEMTRLYRECAVLYYHSTEMRHVHYSPVEAAISGMPVVYFEQSLLGTLTPEITLGREPSLPYAKRAVERILANEQPYVDELRAQQRKLPFKFSDEYCSPEWMKSMEQSGYRAALESQSQQPVFLRELMRSILKPIAKGLSRLPQGDLPFPPYEMLTNAVDDGTTIADGIDFRKENFPWFVGRVSGLSFNEAFGRWTNGLYVDIKFKSRLPKRFKLTIEGGGYGPNIGKFATVKIGRKKQRFAFHSMNGDEKAVMEFWTRTEQDNIHISIPEPVVPPNDNRRIGLAFKSLRIEKI